MIESNQVDWKRGFESYHLLYTKVDQSAPKQLDLKTAYFDPKIILHFRPSNVQEEVFFLLFVNKNLK